jgi:hypothetical protein
MMSMHQRLLITTKNNAAMPKSIDRKATEAASTDVEQVEGLDALLSAAQEVKAARNMKTPKQRQQIKKVLLSDKESFLDHAKSMGTVAREALECVVEKHYAYSADPSKLY